jgi:hypothetical protein
MDDWGKNLMKSAFSPLLNVMLPDPVRRSLIALLDSAARLR